MLWRLYAALYYFGRIDGLPWRMARYFAKIEHRFFAFEFEERPQTPTGYWPIKITFYAEPNNKLLLWRNAERVWCGLAEGMVPPDVVERLHGLGVNIQLPPSR